jgi:hypothetical protein
MFIRYLRRLFPSPNFSGTLRGDISGHLHPVVLVAGLAIRDMIPDSWLEVHPGG